MEDKDTDFLEFRRRLKDLREQYLGITQKMVSITIGISTSYYSAIEKGKMKPNFHFFKQMSSKFDINLNYLLLGKGKPFLGNHPFNIHFKSEKDGISDKLENRGFKPKHMNEFLKLLSEDELFFKHVFHTFEIWSQKIDS